LLIIICTGAQSFAGFFDDVATCLTNPCNCGGGQRDEWWGGQPMYQGYSYPACPPWNKTAGRVNGPPTVGGNGTCLNQTPYPSNFVPYYVSYCAEKSPSSSYFAPNIRVRSETCNVACWAQNATLNWDGQCVIWPGPYGIPMLRICARIAVPESSVPNLDPTQPDQVFPADPGYTIGHHLNSEGYTEADTPFQLEDGTTMVIPSPKLCAYKDPSLYDLVTFIVDVMDYNPNSQPIHGGVGTLSPIGEILIFFINTVPGAVGSLGTLVGQLMDSVVGVIIPGIDVFKTIFDALGLILQKAGGLITLFLTEMLQLNRVVTENLGCVELPLGPYPPPYCPQLVATPPTPSTQPICPINSVTGLPILTSQVNKCVKSSAVNNAIRNSIRITFDNFVPLCAHGENSLTTDKCVNILNAGNLSAANIHMMSANTDLINACSSPSDTSVCVSTMIGVPANAGKFRVVYGSKTGSTIQPNGYYVEDNGIPVTPPALPNPIYDCGDPRAGATCQKIWGVNTGDFIDATLLFPQVEPVQNNSAVLQSNASLTDYNGMSRTFNVSIVRQEVSNQTPNQICVTEGADVVGCQDRPSAPTPQAYECANPPNGVSISSCTDNFWIPQFIASLQAGSDSTNTVVTIYNVHTSTPPQEPINLAGFEYGSFATDYNYTTMPFSGPNAPNSSSIYGTYKNNIPPYPTPTPPAVATYLTGLEYVNSQYIQGGKYACLNLSNVDNCPNDTTLCVLTNLLNRNTVSCSVFFDKVQARPNLRVRTSSDTNCSVIDSIPAATGGTAVNIYQCDPITPGTMNNCYGNPGDPALCVVSMQYPDRFDPAASLGAVLQDSQYYQYVPPSQNIPSFNQDLYGMRNKTPVELQLCTNIVQPQCAEVDAPSSAFDGWAAWPQAEVGEQVAGQCLPGYLLRDASKPLTRYCLSDAELMQVQFEQIDPTGGCVKQEVLFEPGGTNFPANYQYVIAGDSNSGSVTFGERNYDQRVGAGTYYMILNFTVVHSATLSYFRIKAMTYDDYVVVKVNGQKVFSGPGNYTDISQAPNVDLGQFTDTPVIDLLPFVRDGLNPIRIDIKVLGMGVLYYVIEYSF
jgi:hypothetical protein